MTDGKKKPSDFEKDFYDDEENSETEDLTEDDFEDDLDLFGDESDDSEVGEENLPVVIEDREARKPREKELELPVLPLREIANLLM